MPLAIVSPSIRTDIGEDTDSLQILVRISFGSVLMIERSQWSAMRSTRLPILGWCGGGLILRA